MASANSQGGVVGTEMHVGSRKAIITAAESNTLKARAGKVASIVIWGDTAGTSCTVRLYDTAAADTSNLCFGWATAQGLGVYALQMPMMNGIRVITSGTLPTNGGVTVIYT